MDYNILFLLSNILQSNNYRSLLMDFNNILNRYIPYNDSTIYLKDNLTNTINETYQVKSFRYVKGRLYDDLLTYDNFENTLFEYIYINKDSIELRELSKYKDFYKNMTFKELGYKKVIGIPFINGLQVYGGIILKFNEEVDVSMNVLELAIEVLNSKLIILNYNKTEFKTYELLKQIIKKQNIIVYNTSDLNSLDEGLRILVKGNHDTLKNNEKKSCIFSLKKSVYRQIILSDDSGYILDITNEINTHRKVLKDVYYDEELKIYNKNKLIDEINKLDEFTLIKLKYENTYYLDVKNVILEQFKNNKVSYIEGDLVVLLNETDKRKLNKIINGLQVELNNIITLPFNIGVLIYPKDLSNRQSILSTLDAITESKEIFYNKNIHFLKVNEIVKKINIIDLIKENKIDLSFSPVYDLNKHLMAYYIRVNDLDNIEDKRIELSLLKLIINRVKDKDNIFLVDVSSELIRNLNVKQFFQLNKSKNICFIFSEYNNEYFDYISKRDIMFAYKGCIDDFYKYNFKSHYFITSCIYDDTSNLYFDMLGKMEGLKITKPIFKINNIDEYNYLLENQVGLFMTNKYIDESKL